MGGAWFGNCARGVVIGAGWRTPWGKVAAEVTPGAGEATLTVPAIAPVLAKSLNRSWQL